jgi:hypothetical protein
VNGEVNPPQQFNILENGDEKLKQSEQQKKVILSSNFQDEISIKI